MGMSQMKAVARSYMWWPGTDSNIENLAKSCVSSKAVKSAPSEHQCIPGCGQSNPGDACACGFCRVVKGKIFFPVDRCSLEVARDLR